MRKGNVFEYLQKIGFSNPYVFGTQLIVQTLEVELLGYRTNSNDKLVSS